MRPGRRQRLLDGRRDVETAPIRPQANAACSIGLAFPLTASLTVLRGALLDGRGLADLLGSLARLAGLPVLLLGLGAALLRLGEGARPGTGSHQPC